MPKIFKKTAIAAGLAATLGLGATAAHADALAVAVNLISNLLFINPATGLPFDASNFTGLVYTNSADTLASVNGTSSPDSGTGTPLDLYSCVGTGCPANNTFPFTLPPPTNTYATGDQLESGAPISGLGISPVGATVDVAAYASTVTGSSPSGQSNNGLSSTFTFTPTFTTPVTISFNAQEYLDAFTAAGEVFPTNALASTTVCFTITAVGTTTPLVNWCPDGTGTGTGVTNVTDPFSLNTNASRNAPFNGNTQFGPQSGAFSATTITLAAGTAYQLSARQNATADSTEVPEPASLALLGAGIFAFGAFRRINRRRS